ncbi:MAG: molybdenum cofactor guanylyltransferase MobA [Pseudomonadota bacterium]
MPLPTEPKRTVTVVLLAGGAGRRMGGQDKGLLPFRGTSLIAHVLQVLKPQVEQVLINANRNHQHYRELGLPLVSDTLSGGLGPLAGLLSGLEHSDSEYVLSIPCDTPYLPGDLVERMLHTLLQHDAQACTVDDGRRLHPVIMLVRSDAEAPLRDYLQQGGRKVHDWFYSVPHCCADFSDQPEAFTNLNTPAQLNEAQQP